MIDWFFQKNSNFTKLFKKYLIQQLKYSQSFFKEKNKHVSCNVWTPDIYNIYNLYFILHYKKSQYFHVYNGKVIYLEDI